MTRNPELSAALRREVRVRRLVARAFPDPFLENLPPAGALARLARGRIPLGKLMFGQVLSLEIGLRGTARNILVCGPTGTGESNFLQEVFSRPRTFIIRAGGIPVDHLAVVVSLFYMFIYETRRLSRQTQPPVMIVVDDALPIATGSMEWETEGARNPIATWSFHGRSVNIGLVVSVQNFSPISPALRNNADTLVCLGSSGEDAAAVARHMNLNHDQSQELQGLPVGQAIVLARSVWPYAVRAWIAEVG